MISSLTIRKDLIVDMSKEGIKRPLIIPVYKDVDVDIIRGLMRTAGMSRERFFQLLAECK